MPAEKRDSSWYHYIKKQILYSQDVSCIAKRLHTSFTISINNKGIECLWCLILTVIYSEPITVLAEGISDTQRDHCCTGCIYTAENYAETMFGIAGKEAQWLFKSNDWGLIRFLLCQTEHNHLGIFYFLFWLSLNPVFSGPSECMARDRLLINAWWRMGQWLSSGSECTYLVAGTSAPS